MKAPIISVIANKKTDKLYALFKAISRHRKSAGLLGTAERDMLQTSRALVRVMEPGEGGLNMAFSEIDILQILKMFEESSFGELRLENSDVKLLVRKKGCTISAEEPNLEAAPPAMQPITQPMVHQAAGSVASVPEAGLPKATAAVQQGCIPIKSPILGTFYRQPSLDAPPYVEVGSFVKEDDTVCLIEVMKVFTALTAGVRGHIREILADNNSMVEYGQPLFLVEPETTSPGTSA